jgi:large subunit ribosomal protein L5
MADEKPEKKAPDAANAEGAKEKREKREKRKKGEAGISRKLAAEDVKGPPPRLKIRYQKEVVPALMKELDYKNPMQVPRIEKIVVNMGLGESLNNNKIIDASVDQLMSITGQKPMVTRARKAIANFKLRAGQPIGAMVTLRSARMWEFLDRLISLALPRVRDFKGVSTKAFDGKGNYTLGIREQIIFPEINYDQVEKVKGMNISIVTTAQNDEAGRALLRQLGMPFRNN